MLKNPVLEARGVWKGYVDASGTDQWILKGLNMEFWEGEFISVLGKQGVGKSTLLKILSFLEVPDKGEIYFQGRLVGRSNEELEHMRSERIWLIDLSAPNKPLISPPKTLAAVLLDDPTALYNLPLNPIASYRFLTTIYNLNDKGITVVTATKSPKVASLATSIYILSIGQIKGLTDYN